MKAEHRKELQTNVLADRMGRMVTRMKTRPDRRALLWILGALAVVLVLFILNMYWNSKRTTQALLWANLAEGNVTARTRDRKLALAGWVGEYKDTNPALAARYQFAWSLLWEQGIKFLEASPTHAMENIGVAERFFTQLAEDCKEDPVLGPEALYALAVIAETHTVEESAKVDKAVSREAKLDTAIARYKAVHTKYKDSAAGKAAAKRAEYLEKNHDSVVAFYAELQGDLGRFRRQEQMDLPPGILPEKVPPKKQ